MSELQYIEKIANFCNDQFWFAVPELWVNRKRLSSQPVTAVFRHTDNLCSSRLALARPFRLGQVHQVSKHASRTCGHAYFNVWNHIHESKPQCPPNINSPVGLKEVKTHLVSLYVTQIFRTLSTLKPQDEVFLRY